MSDTNTPIVEIPSETPSDIKSAPEAHDFPENKENEATDNKPLENDKPEEKTNVNPKSDETVIPQPDGKELSDFDILKIENENLNIKIGNLECDLQVRTEEKENFKNRAHILENLVTELKNRSPNTLTPQQQTLVDKMKKQSEEILTRAKGVIFDKTKLIKHQELQIETLSLQINSLKEVLGITKELLEIRNAEVKELNEKMEFMEQKIAAERIRQDLVHSKMEAVMKMNTDLKEEYQTQLQLFNDLRSAYSERDRIVNEQKEQNEQNN